MSQPTTPIHLIILNATNRTSAVPKGSGNYSLVIAFKRLHAEADFRRDSIFNSDVSVLPATLWFLEILR